MTLKDAVMFVFLALVWGSSYLWIKVAVAEVAPFTLVAWRLLFGLVVLGPILLWKRPAWPARPQAWSALALLGVVDTALPFTLISWGETRIDSAMASILIGAVPLFVLVLAHRFLQDERMTWLKSAGVLTGFVGILVLVSPNLSPAGVQAGFWGQLAVLGAALCYALAVVYARRALKGIAPLVQAFFATAFAGLAITAGAFLWESPQTLPAQPLTWTALAVLGALGTGLAYAVYYTLIQTIGSTRASTVTYVAPVAGVVLGVAFLGEPLTWPLALGTLLVVGSVLAVNRRAKPAAVAAPGKQAT